MTLEFIEELNDLQVLDLHKMFQVEFWSQTRELDDIRQMLQNTDVIVGFCESNSKHLVAFARVITDFTYKALVLDVIVSETHRDQKLGRSLLDTLVKHPKLQSVQHFELYCLPNMVPFYEKWGFTIDLGKLCFMRRSQK